MKEKKGLFLLCAILSLLISLSFSIIPVTAQDEDTETSGPITKIDLGVSSLQLAVGESYTFQVKYEPEDTVLTTLDWYVSDESVLSLDPMTATITALAEGEARIFAESFDQFSYDVCTVTVGGSISKDPTVTKSGSDFLGLSQQDLNKISAGTLTRYLDFIADSPIDDEDYRNLSSRNFDVVASVKKGSGEEQLILAQKCGIESAEALSELNAVTLTGSLSAILCYAKDNRDLLDIFEFGPFYLDDPVIEEDSDESIQKTVGLQGNTEKLTSVSFAQNKLGLNGKGRWIAVIDSGINYKNAQFTNSGRSIIEKCFSKAQKYSNYTLRSVCTDGSEGKGASGPFKAWRANAFDHGSHVTGIAAGRNGIAPLANIISIQSHTEKVWTCKDSKERTKYSCGKNHSNQCCKTYINNSDLARSYNYLLELSKKNKIDAVNMSYGNSVKHTGPCNTGNWEKNYLDKMVQAGMLPVVSAGNDSYTGAIGSAACVTSAYAVSALADNPDPLLANYSNHSSLVAIAAPGTKILSAGYSKDTMYKSGTSMAAPMVAGAIALVKQMYPGMTPEDAGNFLKYISYKNVLQRQKGGAITSKPVLTFGRIHWLNVPYYSWVTGGNNSITIKVYRMNRQANFSAQVTTLQGKKIDGLKMRTTQNGNYTYITISGSNLQNGQIYKVILKRSFTIGKTSHWASTTVYGRPEGNPPTPEATAENKGVSLKTNSTGNVHYNIYDQKTGKLVKQENVTKGTTPHKITGLVNGRLYSVRAYSYRTISITKDGKKKNINFYSTESAPILFVPMSKPFNTKVSYPIKNTNSSIVSCTADSAANGIIVAYRKSGTSGNWTPGCRTGNGKFSCTVSVGRGYDFQIRKYTTQTKEYYGPAAIVKVR